MSEKTIMVLSQDNMYLSHCTQKRALKLLQSNRAVIINANTIKLVQDKKEMKKLKQNIIEESNRTCYICGRKIPYNKIATIDHVVPKSRNNKANMSSNMKCCCIQCNNDKNNMTINEYIVQIMDNRKAYDYISDNQLNKLIEFASIYEKSFYLMT